ncbi:MAG: hypothetical protein JWM77_3208 [Rhodospirillales bacterium]|nr:hypothetical protein [Rhodospirillales bacterium]
MTIKREFRRVCSERRDLNQINVLHAQRKHRAGRQWQRAGHDEVAESRRYNVRPGMTESGGAYAPWRLVWPAAAYQSPFLRTSVSVKATSVSITLPLYSSLIAVRPITTAMSGP